MGTRFELVLADEDESHAHVVGEEAIREIELWHSRLSRFETSSDVARLNRDGGGRVDAELFELLALCEEVRAASDGAFDIAVGRMMEELGFHPANPEASSHSSSRSERNSGSRGRKPPETRQCKSESPGGATQRISLNAGDTTIALAPGVALDFGAVAKGFALDRAAAILMEHGITHALLHGGTSSVVAIGEWSISVRSDSEPLSIRLCDHSFSVSAPRGRTLSPEPGTRNPEPDLASHILDPRTGRPARALDTAAVVGPLHTAALCDAWSTALVVLGDRPATMPADLLTHLHAPATGWRSLPRVTIPC